MGVAPKLVRYDERTRRGVAARPEALARRAARSAGCPMQVTGGAARDEHRHPMVRASETCRVPGSVEPPSDPARDRSAAQLVLRCHDAAIACWGHGRLPFHPRKQPA